MIITLQTLIFFRESFLTALDRLLRPYYKKFSLAFGRNGDVSDDEGSDEQVFAEFDDEKGVVFYPPVYSQRYAAVSDCLMDERWCGKLEKVVDLGYHDMSFIKYLKEVPGIKCILGVDIESIPLRCSSDLMACDDYMPKRENPLQVTLFKGNAADPDYRLIGCDAVVAVEMIEHMLPHDLDRLIHTVFGFIKPWVVVFTTPNGDFNVLFKALEKNGLRRLDHFFEWSREQFHDWCSNIVERYPEYTVSCKGIGPGPSGTLHLGCCSQMAMFVAKEYTKQQDLNLNALALVSDTPSPHNINELLRSWDNTVGPIESNMICPPNNTESYSELNSEKQSCITIILTSPSLHTLEYHDKTSQCNLDSEAGKNYLMFDYEQMCYDVVVPRRNVENRVYVIEDVASRLNCTTLQVKKFSKTTQNLMAKNKVDSLVHTREVVDEIRHLTKMLNFNKDCINQVPENDSSIWCNINWGDNAPYWNQYYKVVRDYNYPFETKSDECRILDLISAEINRLIDNQYDDEFLVSVDANKMEIPIEHLMTVVQHITDDVEKVKDLLEWNGYVVVDNVVIYSRLVVDNTSVGTQEDDWQETDAYSDWDSTDIRSTSFSEGSAIVPDYHARCLRRALDHKVRKLRSTLTADEDITTELDRVVCRLMKLALRTSKGRESPPPTRWMQCKLLDLLTLTENAIERRKRHYITNYPFKAINYEEKSEEMIALEKIKEDDTGLKIVNKYNHLVKKSDIVGCTEETRAKYHFIDFELEDDLSISSAEFVKDYEFIDRHSPSLFGPEASLNDMKLCYPKEMGSKEESKLERTQAWLENGEEKDLDKDAEVVSYPNHDKNFDNSSGDTDHSGNNIRNYYKKSFKRYRGTKCVELNCVVSKKSHSEAFGKKHRKCEKKLKDRSKAKLIKKVSRKISGYNILVRNTSHKYVAVENRSNRVKIRSREHKQSYPTESKPIPASLIELCHPELMLNKNIDFSSNEPVTSPTSTDDQGVTSKQSNFPKKIEVAATTQSLLLDIVSADAQETIAFRRTIGTDAEVEPLPNEDEELIRSVSNTILNNDLFEKHDPATENVHSQTIFLYDINEPTTSKGIRHVSMDVQCGPDMTDPAYAMQSATTSLTRMPKMFSAAIRIEETTADTTMKSTGCGPCTNNTEIGSKIITPNFKSVGIIIKDSEPNVCKKVECSTNTQEAYDRSNTSSPQQFSTETKLLKSIPSGLKMYDSGSEFCGSIGSFPKSSSPIPSFQNNILETISSVSKDVGVTNQSGKYVRPKLCNGGVQVHSYRDKQTSEDIMYQGEWQNHRPKVLTSKNVYNPVAPRKVDLNIKKKVISKEKIPYKISVQKGFKQAPKKLLLPLKSKLPNLKQEKNKNQIKPNQKNSFPNIVKVNRQMRTLTKVATKLVTSSAATKTSKSAFAVKKASITSNISVTKNDGNPPKIALKKYVPLYLKRRIESASDSNKPNLNASLDSAKINIKINKEKTIKPLVRSYTEEIKRDLLKFQSTAPTPNYVVLRNEVEKKNSGSNEKQVRNTPDEKKKRDATVKRSISPQSQNSSTCSSPNSIATVRAASLRTKNRRHSASSYKCTTTNSESENTTPDRSEKFSKRCKSANINAEKVSDNKENMPQSSRQFNTGKKERTKVNTGVFMGQKKEVFVAHVKETSPIQSKNKVQKSNVIIPKADSFVGKSSISPSISKNTSQSDRSSLTSSKDGVSESLENLNMVLVLEPQTYTDDLAHQSSNDSPKTNPVNLVNNRLITDWIDSSHKSAIDIHTTTNLISTMRQLIEETLDFIDGPIDNNGIIDSETVILSRENLTNQKIDVNLSPTSFKTIITSDENYNDLLQGDIEYALNRSFDTTLGNESIVSLNDTRLTITDLDTLSFKSITSISKYSEYFSADNEISSSREKLPAPNTSSVRDIFERKDQLLTQGQNIAGALAIQAFSGFSINGEPAVGDQPDPANLIDSETGSLAVGTTRQAASEELFISGRSSDSFLSCVLDEDAVVPNWLFQIISRQQSAMDEEEPPGQLMIPMSLPVVDPMYDENGNMEAGVVGAGAGDGRGMHSDLSQDSSGRGTSVSSSDTSSGPQSEVIMIDPSAFVAQFEMLREEIDRSIVVLALNDPAEALENAAGSGQAVPAEADAHSYSRGESRRTPRAQVAAAASDVDADVSSIDTDVPDSN